MGTVYKAEDQRFNGRIVAVKEMRLENAHSNAVEQFKGEAYLLAGLTHPQLPRIYDYFTEDQRWYLVMDYIEGETLESYLNKAADSKLQIDEALKIGIQIASVLQYLHSRPTTIIFRDLKPLNVMITPEKHIYLIDFGIARHFKPGQDQDTVVYLTKGYAAPEQFWNMQTTPRSDIYSLGRLLYRMICGYNPTSYQDNSLQNYQKAIPIALSMLVNQMMQLDPEQRPSSMEEVKQRLETILQDLHQQQYASMTVPSSVSSTPLGTQFRTPSLPGATSSRPDKKRNNLLRWLLAGVIFIVLLNVGFFAWFIENQMGPTSNATLTPTATTQTTPFSTGQASIAHPSRQLAEYDIKYYYTHVSDFRGKQVIQQFDSLTLGPLVGPKYQPRFTGCAQYEYASVKSPDIPLGTARHTFEFLYKDKVWRVITMGNWNSC